MYRFCGKINYIKFYLRQIAVILLHIHSKLLKKEPLFMPSFDLIFQCNGWCA